MIRGYKGCNFYGEALERFVREELSVMGCSKGKCSATVIRAGRYEHIGHLERKEKWTVKQDLYKDSAYSRQINLWEDTTVYGETRTENEYQKTLEILGDFYYLTGYCITNKKNDDRRTVEKEVNRDAKWYTKSA